MSAAAPTVVSLTPAQRFIARGMSEDALGEHIRAACLTYGWRFLWLRKTYNSSAGILDLLLIPLTDLEHRHVLFRELKGYDKRGRLGDTTPEQDLTIECLRTAGEDAAVWTPEDWVSGEILRVLT